MMVVESCVSMSYIKHVHRTVVDETDHPYMNSKAVVLRDTFVTLIIDGRLRPHQKKISQENGSKGSKWKMKTTTTTRPPSVPLGTHVVVPV
jgi:hypothetical protein